jgi:hypothetical protein
MSRNAPIVLAILLVLGSSGLSASAFARDGGYDAGRASVSVRGNSFGGCRGGTVGYSGLRGEFRGNQGRDVWGHWGAYYGPMIPMT